MPFWLPRSLLGLSFAGLLCVPSAWAETIEVEMIYPPADPAHGALCHTPEGDVPADASLLAMLDQESHQATASTAGESQSVQVDQLIDTDADDPLKMFRFSPNYIEIQPGDSIRFMNSLGQHTVVSIKGMIPEGAEPFSIAHEKVAEVTFEQPGVYGIRCRVHSRYGMVMLVKVGDELPNLEQAREKRHYRKAAKQFKQLFQRLDRSLVAEG
ncbi:plastocyanin/azurin family copper-binding protein [Aestuariirhabdus sp. Z084]|uniref:plastocyanin/azurin family copper-binding protein n=1 Tax=Aestuariirhabdus haliotis TaxID=2918751 RepID=UPI00201B3E2B|nr:plastocyanin/azurin family copper-binding protein [Aestuariirhabdus haliotis]MCL6415176.1 plastocyanin/azurin family copper-binding protein [Aestuariirhabdus haliotis]MCL6420051.1 plastocyanin/azurin family copper-binding protein [Aestuariirhabdus haliotis]